jgi:type II secretory pathway pseudopilin PulG
MFKRNKRKSNNLQATSYKLQANDAFSLVEVILSIAIFGMIVTVIVGALIYGQQSTVISGMRARAVFLADEGIEAVKSIKDNAWNEVIFSKSAVNTTGNQWNFTGEGSTENIDQYTRTITFSNVCRNSLGDITPCPGDYTDIYTKKVTSEVSWVYRPGFTQSVQKEGYITNWRSSNWVQTDWSGGDGQTIWSDQTRYSIDDGNIDSSTSGEIKLDSIGGSTECDGYTWAFDTPSNYNYDSAKIEVTGGYAQLKSEGATTTGQTSDSSFDTGTPWTSGTWDLGSSESSVSTRRSTGGNPIWWAETALGTQRKNKTVGGYWQQAFTTTVDNLDSVTISLDHITTLFNVTSGTTAYFYMFVDTSAGAPSGIENAVWSQQITGTTGWTNVSSIDATSQVTVAGTYYLKVAIWLDVPNSGSNTTWRYVTGGYDNVQLSWSKSTSGYPTDRPSISNVSSYEPTSIAQWSSFTATENKNGGEIYYQLSDDDGVTWYYWSGTSWATAGASDYNTADIINSNIQSFSVTNKKLMFNAFLESDGSQLVQLDQIDLDCSTSGSLVDDTQVEFDLGTYVNTNWNTNRVELTPVGMTNGSGTFTSTIFNIGGIMNWEKVEWTSTAPYGKPLPDNGNVETAYSQGNVDMSQNMLLYHLDESLGSISFIDTSGNGYNASCSGSTCPTTDIVGQLDTALDLDGIDDYIGVSTDLNQWLGGTASVSYWIKTTQVGDTVFWNSPGILGIENSVDGNDIFWGWIDDTGRIGFNVGDSGGILSTSPVNDNQWHNIFLTRDSASGLIQLYVDGSLNNQGTFDAGLKTSSFYSVGRIEDTGGTPVYYDGIIDELSIWNSVLGSTFALDIYKRGMLKLKFQVRTCDDAVCDTEQFIGFDGTGLTFYSEIYNSVISLPSFNLTGVNDNQYFQYRAVFETGNSSYTPELQDISITYGEIGGGSGVFETVGDLTSSAYDMGRSSSVQAIEWDESIPTCIPVCTVRLQIRAAPDSGGSPGTWTDWYGPGGSGGYFTQPLGAIIPVALNGNQWVQYRAFLDGDGNDTPVLEEVRVNYR